MIAMICGPYTTPSQQKKSRCPTMQLFHIRDEKPYSLKFDVLGQQLVPKSFVADLKQLMVKVG